MIINKTGLVAEGMVMVIGLEQVIVDLLDKLKMVEEIMLTSCKSHLELS